MTSRQMNNLLAPHIIQYTRRVLHVQRLISYHVFTYAMYVAIYAIYVADVRIKL